MWLRAREEFADNRFQLLFIYIDMHVYIYIIYICQDGGAVGFVDFTKLSFALSSLAQPFDQMESISEYVFVILSQRKAYAGRFQKEAAIKRTGPITKWPPRRLLFTRLEIVFVIISAFTKRTKVVLCCCVAECGQLLVVFHQEFRLQSGLKISWS